MLKSGNSAVGALRGRGRRLESFHKDCTFKTEGHATISSDWTKRSGVLCYGEGNGNMFKAFQQETDMNSDARV